MSPVVRWVGQGYEACQRSSARRRRVPPRFSAALKEIIDARVTGAIHFRTADVQGAVLGKKVVHHMNKHYFQPTG